MKKSLLVAVSLILGAQANAASLEENNAYFNSLDKVGQTQVLQALYMQMLQREQQANADRDKFVEAFAQVSNLVSNSIKNNQSVAFKAEGYRQEFGSNPNFKQDHLMLKPSVTYLMNFEDKTLKSNQPADPKNKDVAVFLYFDALRNVVIVENPGIKTGVVAVSEVSFESIRKTANEINPNFKY